MRHILRGVIRGTGLGDFDAAGRAATAKIRVGVRIAYIRAIDLQRVVVEAGNKWRRSRQPGAVGLLGHVDFRAAPEVELHGGGVRRFHAHLHFAGAIDARVLGAPNICFGRLERIRLLGPAQNCGHEEQRENRE